MSSIDNKPAFRLAGISRTFHQGRATLEVLRGVDLDLFAGEVTALVGPSGAGKSTLLHIAGLLERPDAGEVTIGGVDCNALADGERTRIRCGRVGFVYQYHHLLPEFSALENVSLPQMIGGTTRAAADSRSRDLLTTLGLAERLRHRPGQLSGGEQQRVAIARALANRPTVLLADEPTGNLDPETAGDVFKHLLGLVRSIGLTALVATHNMTLAERMDRTVRLETGRLVTV